MIIWILGKQFKEKALPPINKLHSSLNKTDINTDDYEHAKNVWGKIWAIITTCI